MTTQTWPPFTRVEAHAPRRRHPPRHIVLAGALVAAASLLAWWLVEPRTPDLAAQVYRAHLYSRVGFTVWDNNWYAGHHVPGYSLLFPPLAHLVGLRVLGVMAAMASSLLFATLIRGPYPAAGPWVGACFALGATADVWIGRLTFALGVAVGLAAVLAASRERRGLAAVLAALSAAASPVVGLFLSLAALTEALATWRVKAALMLGVPPLAVAGAMSVLFPEGGRQPFAATSVAATFAAACAFMILVPARDRVLRVGGALYLVAVALSVLVSSPMGSNVARLGVLFGAPLLLATHARTRSGSERRFGAALAALTVGVLGLIVWMVWGPVREAIKVAHDPSVTSAYYAPVRAYLTPRLVSPARVEVPFTRGHWETVTLGDRLALARGWERQLDTRYDDLFFSGPLNATRYEAWLRTNAVRFVALPDAPLDVSGRREGQLVGAGLPDLRLVFHSAHWRVFAVTDALPLVQGAGELISLTRDGFSVRARAAGALLIRVHYTRYWHLLSGAGCLASAPGGWTTLSVPRAETVRVRARFSWAAALDTGRRCQAG